MDRLVSVYNCVRFGFSSALAPPRNVRPEAGLFICRALDPTRELVFVFLANKPLPVTSACTAS